VGSNPAEGMSVSLSCECRLLSGRSLCVELIIRPEESYRVGVSECNREASSYAVAPLEKSLRIGNVKSFFCISGAF
jgi:hypothetical protein